MHILKCETGLTIGLALFTSAHESNERLELTHQGSVAPIQFNSAGPTHNFCGGVNSTKSS